MLDDDPVTLWIDDLRGADDAAAEKLWKHFVSRLYELARHKLQPTTHSVYDEEDAALSAFQSVCAGVVAGRFPDLQDRDSLWRLMLVITSRKVKDRHRYDHQQKRDVHRNVSSYIFADSTADSLPRGMEQLPSREPTPEFAAEFVDTCQSLFQRLDDPQLQEVVSLRMEGYTDSEIAVRQSCTRRTVQRSLELIRRQWNKEELAGE